jgi:hypothetical protein
LCRALVAATVAASLAAVPSAWAIDDADVAYVPSHVGPQPGVLNGVEVSPAGVVANVSTGESGPTLGRYYLPAGATAFTPFLLRAPFDGATVVGDDLALVDVDGRNVRFTDTSDGSYRQLTYQGTLAGIVPGATPSIAAWTPGEAAKTYVLTRYGHADLPETVATVACATAPSSVADADGVALLCQSATDATSDDVSAVAWDGTAKTLATVARFGNAYLQMSSTKVAWRYAAPGTAAQSLAVVPRDGSAAVAFREVADLNYFALLGDHVAWTTAVSGTITLHTAPADPAQPELSSFVATGLYSSDVWAGPGHFVVRNNPNVRTPGLSKLSAGDTALTHWVDAPNLPATPWSVDLDAGRVLWSDDSADGEAETYARSVSHSDGTTSLGAESVAGTTPAWPGAVAVSGSRVAELKGSDPASAEVLVTDGGTVVRHVPVTPDLAGFTLSGRRLLLSDETDESSSSKLVDVVTGGSLALPGGAVLWGRYVVYVDASERIVRRDLDAPLSATNPLVLRAAPTASCPDCAADDFTMLAVNGQDVFWDVFGFEDEERVVARVSGTTVAKRNVPVSDVWWADLGPAGLAVSQFVGSFTSTPVSLVDVDGLFANQPNVVTPVGDASVWVPPAVDDRFVAWAGHDRNVRVTRSPYGSGRAATLLSAVAPGAFSPNADAVLDTWNASFDADEPLSAWTLTVKNAAGSVVATRTGSAPLGAIRTSWNGRSDADAVLPDATYTWTLTGTSADGDGALRRSDGVAAAITGTVAIRKTKPVVVPTPPVVSTDRSGATTFPVSWTTNSPGVRTFDVVVYELTRNASGAWVAGPSRTLASNTTARSLNFAGAQGHTYRFGVRGRDDAGNVGGLLHAPTVVPYDERTSAAAYSAGWSSVTSSGRFMNTLRTSTTKGAKVTFTGDMREFRLVGEKCATCGQMAVYVDGRYVATLDSYSATAKARQVLWGRSLGASVGRHTVTLVVSGTYRRSRVSVDGFAASR